MFGFGFGVAGEDDLAPVGGGQVDIDHLDGAHFFEHGPGGQAWASALRRWPSVTCTQ